MNAETGSPLIRQRGECSRLRRGSAGSVPDLDDIRGSDNLAVIPAESFECAEVVLLAGGAATIRDHRHIVIDEIGIAAKRFDAGVGRNACQQQTADLAPASGLTSKKSAPQLPVRQRGISMPSRAFRSRIGADRYSGS